MALTPAERNSSEQVQCGGPQKGCGKPLPRVGRKPFLAACAPPGTYPPAPTSPGDEMQWHCHGANYEELISNLQSSSYELFLFWSFFSSIAFVHYTCGVTWSTVKIFSSKSLKVPILFAQSGASWLRYMRQLPCLRWTGSCLCQPLATLTTTPLKSLGTERRYPPLTWYAIAPILQPWCSFRFTCLMLIYQSLEWEPLKWRCVASVGMCLWLKILTLSIGCISAIWRRHCYIGWLFVSLSVLSLNLKYPVEWCNAAFLLPIITGGSRQAWHVCSRRWLRIWIPDCSLWFNGEEPFRYLYFFILCIWTLVQCEPFAEYNVSLKLAILGSCRLERPAVSSVLSTLRNLWKAQLMLSRKHLLANLWTREESKYMVSIDRARINNSQMRFIAVRWF